MMLAMTVFLVLYVATGIWFLSQVIVWAKRRQARVALLNVTFFATTMLVWYLWNSVRQGYIPNGHNLLVTWGAACIVLMVIAFRWILSRWVNTPDQRSTPPNVGESPNQGSITSS